MSKNKKLPTNPTSLLNLSKADLNSSVLLIENMFFSQAVFAFEQAVEKACKYIGLKSGRLTEEEVYDVCHYPHKVFLKYLKRVNEILVSLNPTKIQEKDSIQDLKDDLFKLSEKIFSQRIFRLIKDSSNDEYVKIDKRKSYVDNFNTFLDSDFEQLCKMNNAKCIKVYATSDMEEEVRQDIITNNTGFKSIMILLYLSYYASYFNMSEIRYGGKKVEDPTKYFNEESPYIQIMPYLQNELSAILSNIEIVDIYVTKDNSNIDRNNSKSKEIAYNELLSGNKLSDRTQRIIKYTNAINLYPEFAEAYHNRGYEYLEQKEYDNAIIDFEKALELNENLPQTYHNLGIIYSLKGQYNDAISNFNKAIELSPEYMRAYMSRANAHSNFDNHYKAIEEYSFIIYKWPCEEAFYNRSLSYSKLSNSLETNSPKKNKYLELAQADEEVCKKMNNN